MNGQQIDLEEMDMNKIEWINGYMYNNGASIEEVAQEIGFETVEEFLDGAVDEVAERLINDHDYPSLSIDRVQIRELLKDEAGNIETVIDGYIED